MLIKQKGVNTPRHTLNSALLTSDFLNVSEGVTTAERHWLVELDDLCTVSLAQCITQM